MESGRKGRKLIRLGPVPLREYSEEEGDYMDRDNPWRISILSHMLGKRVPLARWRSGRSNRRAVGNLNSTHEECTHASLLPEQGRDGRVKLH